MRTDLSVIAGAAVVLFVCGCGGSGSPSTTTTSAGSAQATGALAFSRCMRSHGVSGFPDPDSSGNVPKNKVIPLASSPQFRVASTACQHLVPGTGAPMTTHAEVEAAVSGMVRFAACMRAHGVQSWPDPIVDRSRPGDPRPVFDLHCAIDPTAPRITADVSDCQHLMPQSTTPYFCSRILAQHVPGSPPGAEACGGGSPEVP